MKSVLFRGWRKNAGVEEIRLESDEITVHIVPGSEPLTVAVAGRTTVDSSPYLRSVLLGLLRRGTAPVVIIDLSDRVLSGHVRHRNTFGGTEGCS